MASEQEPTPKKRRNERQSKSLIYDFYIKTEYEQPGDYFLCKLCSDRHIVRRWNDGKLDALYSHLDKHTSMTEEELFSCGISNRAIAFFYERTQKHKIPASRRVSAPGCDKIRIGSQEIKMSQFAPDPELVSLYGAMIAGIATGSSIISQCNAFSRVLSTFGRPCPNLQTIATWLSVFGDLFWVQTKQEVRNHPVSLTFRLWNAPLCAGIHGNFLVVIGNYIKPLSSKWSPGKLSTFLMDIVDLNSLESSLQEEINRIVSEWEVVVVHSVSSLNANMQLDPPFLDHSICAVETLSLICNIALKNSIVLANIKNTLDSLAKFIKFKSLKPIERVFSQDNASLLELVEVSTNQFSFPLLLNNTRRLHTLVTNYCSNENNKVDSPKGLEDDQWNFLFIVADVFAVVKNAIDKISELHESTAARLSSVIRQLIVFFRVICSFFPEYTIESCFGVTQEQLECPEFVNLQKIHQLQTRISECGYKKEVDELLSYLWAGVHVIFVSGITAKHEVKDVIIKVGKAVQNVQCYFNDHCPLKGVDPKYKVASFFDPALSHMKDLDKSEQLTVLNIVKQQMKHGYTSINPVVCSISQTSQAKETREESREKSTETRKSSRTTYKKRSAKRSPQSKTNLSKSTNSDESDHKSTDVGEETEIKLDVIADTRSSPKVSDKVNILGPISNRQPQSNPLIRSIENLDFFMSPKLTTINQEPKTIDEEIDRYLDSTAQFRGNYPQVSTFEFWKSYQNQVAFPRIFQLSRYFLTSLASSTNCEPALNIVSSIMLTKRKRARISFIRSLLALVLVFVDQPTIQIDYCLISQFASIASTQNIELLFRLECFCKYGLEKSILSMQMACSLEPTQESQSALTSTGTADFSSSLISPTGLASVLQPTSTNCSFVVSPEASIDVQSKHYVQANDNHSPRALLPTANVLIPIIPEAKKRQNIGTMMSPTKRMRSSLFTGLVQIDTENIVDEPDTTLSMDQNAIVETWDANEDRRIDDKIYGDNAELEAGHVNECDSAVIESLFNQIICQEQL